MNWSQALDYCQTRFDDDDEDVDEDGVRRIYQRRICLQVSLPLVYPPGFGHHYHHDGDDGNVGDDDDLGVTWVYEDAKRKKDFVAELGHSKKSRKPI